MSNQFTKAFLLERTCPELVNIAKNAKAKPSIFKDGEGRIQVIFEVSQHQTNLEHFKSSLFSLDLQTVEHTGDKARLRFVASPKIASVLDLIDGEELVRDWVKVVEGDFDEYFKRWKAKTVLKLIMSKSTLIKTCFQDVKWFLEPNEQLNDNAWVVSAISQTLCSMTKTLEDVDLGSTSIDIEFKSKVNV